MKTEIQRMTMTPKEVARETHSSLRLIYRQLQKGNIPHIKLGDKYLIGRKAFEDWLYNGGK